MTANTNMTKSLMNRTMPLAQAIKDAPNASGCYQLYHDGKLVYVGKAQDGIRKRFVQYYNGTTAHYTSAQKIYAERDNIHVKWSVIQDPAEVTQKEAMWIKKYTPEWNKQSGWGDKGVLADKAPKEIASMGQKEVLNQIGKGMATNAVASAGVTAVTEIGKGILNHETVGDCTEHTVSNSLKEGAKGAALVGTAMLTGALGPVSTVLAIGASEVVGEVVESACDEIGFHAGLVMDEVADKVTDVFLDVSMGVENFFDNVFSWFW